MERMEQYEADGAVRSRWSSMKQMEQCEADGSVWSRWSSMEQMEQLNRNRDNRKAKRKQKQNHAVVTHYT